MSIIQIVERRPLIDVTRGETPEGSLVPVSGGAVMLLMNFDPVKGVPK